MTKLPLLLLVDDDEISNYVTQKHIELSNLIEELVVKLNGKQAADYLDTSKKYPDLILLDINMPIMNGFELLDHYCKQPYHGKTKIAILSTSTHKKDKEAALNYPDVIAYIEKPLTIEKISELVVKVMNS